VGRKRSQSSDMRHKNFVKGRTSLPFQFHVVEGGGRGKKNHILREGGVFCLTKKRQRRYFYLKGEKKEKKKRKGGVQSLSTKKKERDGGRLSHMGRLLLTHLLPSGRGKKRFIRLKKQNVRIEARKEKMTLSLPI